MAKVKQDRIETHKREIEELKNNVVVPLLENIDFKKVVSIYAESINKDYDAVLKRRELNELEKERTRKIADTRILRVKTLLSLSPYDIATNLTNRFIHHKLSKKDTDDLLEAIREVSTMRFSSYTISLFCKRD